MSLYNMFKTDKDLESRGIFIEYGDNSKGEPIRFKIARAGGQNQEFNKALEAATKPYRRALQNGTLADSKAEELYRKVFIGKVLLGWTGVEDEEGNDIPFSRENAEKLFTDLPDLYQDLREQSSNAALFRQEELEEDLGNSGACSNTTSSKGKSSKK